MNLLDSLKSLHLENYSMAMVSTTAKQTSQNRLLPFQELAGQDAINMIINDEELAVIIFSFLDEHIELFFIDVERKMPVNLWGIAKKTLKHAKYLPYKPNDLTREAAYNFIAQHFDYQLAQKKCLIYGSGNIATKLALYLAEHNAQVSLKGRNISKLGLLKEALNAILPAYNNTPLSLYSEDDQYDVLITVLSAENCVSSSLLENLTNNAIIIDVGINNLSPSFIAKAQVQGNQIFRLDVRAGAPFLEAMLKAYYSPFMQTHVGEVELAGISCVSGGAIGKKGSIVLDTILKPTNIIGIANGTGGIKKYEEYSEQDFIHYKKISSLLQTS